MGIVASGDQDANTSTQNWLDARRGSWRYGPWRQRTILGCRDWDADGLGDIVRDYVIEHWQMTTRSSCSTTPAFSSRAKRRADGRGNTIGFPGKVTNCQIESPLPTFRAAVQRFSDRAPAR
jgi:SRSO17 transposase